MGATTFFDYETGDTVDHAYHRAVKDALHWHGHGGYSGTIAEKECFVLIPRPPRISAETVCDTLDLAYQAWEWDAAPESERKWLTKPSAEHRAYWGKVQKWFGFNAGEIMETYNAKWGPCLAISTTASDKTRWARLSNRGDDARLPRGYQLYELFGWASC